MDEPTAAISRAAAFFDVDNTMMVGASVFHFAKGLAARHFFSWTDLARFAARQARLRLRGESSATCTRPARARWRSSPARRSTRSSRSARDLRRGDGRQDLVGHARAGPAAPRRRPPGLAGDRDPGRAGHDHRVAAAPDRRARHGGRDARRRLHRPPGRRGAARRGEGGRGARAGRARGARPRRGARPTPTRSTTCRCCRWSDGRWRSIRIRPCWPRRARAAGRSATSAPVAGPPGSACRSVLGVGAVAGAVAAGIAIGREQERRARRAAAAAAALAAAAAAGRWPTR